MSKLQAERRNRLRKEKRGVVLLVVVSILTLFLMIGVTYVLVAGNYNKAAGQALRARTYGDESEREIEEVLGQILFGSRNSPGGLNPLYVISPHSLLADLYGNGGVVGTINTIINFPNAGQCIHFSINPPAQPQLIPNYYAGRVITFADGPAAGISTRVMAYIPPAFSASGNPEFVVETPESDLPIPVAPSAGARFLINGAPFTGTGAGYDPTTLNLDSTITLTSGTPYPTALLPNYSLYPGGATNPPALGGLDEPYDAADYQNMFLAMVPPQKLSQFDNFPLLPSFHRPDLIKYWINTLSSSSLLSGSANPRGAFLNAYSDPSLSATQVQEIIALKRMMIFRPLIEDHPNFTGGNQNFVADSLNGPYDIDNDGDGITDSIWIDPGLPVVTAPNGRRYKRLVAILIKDLDGRVNPNVHGNQILAGQAPTTSTRTSFPVTDTFAGMDPNNPSQIYLPRGLGFGPAEVDFQHIFNNTLPYSSVNDDFTTYNNILSLRYQSNVSGQQPRPGFSDGNPANVSNHDGWSQMKMIGMPGAALNMGTYQVINQGDHTTYPPFSAYSTPPDVWGRGALAVDYTGQPLWFLLGTGERTDNPYEMQWDQLRANVDTPYTVSELEALLRYHDQGASVIPSRLMQYAGNYLATDPRGAPYADSPPFASQRRREAFGMGSYIPSPKLVMPREQRAGYFAATGNNNPTLLDLYAYRLQFNYNDFQTIVPFEFLKGQLFNLNREFGNGVDDNGDNVVDDPGEFGGEMVPTLSGLYPPQIAPYPFSYLNDTPPAKTPDQRQMYARHLYCLLMLLANQGAPNYYDLDGDGTPTPQETARMYAQWAVNVVDFRDADSIMTPFEYDINPFDGSWDVDGVLGPGSADDTSPMRGLVWGCERPELVITEGTAGHDRRTEDLKDDGQNSNNGQVGDPEKDGMNDFDQRLMPEGWAFIELYNPWFDRSNNSYDHKPAEIYTNGGVDLSKVNNSGSPVWRMIFVRGTNHYNTDPDFPQPEALTVGVNGTFPYPNTTVDRTVYFANLNGAGVNLPGGSVGEIYFPSYNNFPSVPVQGGRYAVVGSSGNVDNAAGTFTTYIGRTSADSGFDPALFDRANTRRIVLNPNAQTVRVQNNVNGGGADDVDPTTIQSVVALPLDSVIRNGTPVSQSFNITEPVGGYFAMAPPPPPYAMWQPPGANDEGHFSPAADAPFDYQRGLANPEYAFLANNVTQINFRSVNLQRLANPLLAWNQFTNPYLTVDKSSLDVMAYNGVSSAKDPQAVEGVKNFQSFQRGGRYFPTDPEMVNGYTPPATGFFRRLWQQEVPFAVPTADSPLEMGTATHFQPRTLYQTLGLLNKRYHPYFGAAAPAIYRGAPYFQDVNGQIASPFPYFPFNNRPFNNPMELLQVPCWSSSQLLNKYSFEDHTAPNWTNMYQPASPPNVNVPYGHLLNFFNTSNNPNGNSNAPELCRLLDYVETRTPYLQTEKYYNAAAFFNDPQTPAGYRPPFNYLSRFREPGRININTIFDFDPNNPLQENVWNAAVRGFPGMCTLNPPLEGDGGQFFLRLAMNRQGWGGANGASDLLTILNYDVTHPSYFSNPFRTADSADLMPSTPATLRQSPANGGLLRQDPYLATPGFQPPNPPPLPAYPAPNGTEPLFASESVAPHQDAARNPYFRYQALQKVGNTFSTNSNCFAVWITVGYFEVEANDADNNPNTPAQIDQAHPDGLRLAQEVGADEGNVKRHRAFFIIDRSIPVGYEPGHRHNTDKAVLLKRFIE